MSSWLVIGMAVLVMWTLWGFLNWIFNVLEIWHAARRGEDAQATKGKGSFS
jgi:hypothetical protein